ncbi:hypothetical protein AQJ46_29175 [Streptomyces canus]|uniref:Uncharacterized protein n=1 Tax=Streptomyces canus TaxID=58343 RepID=A0A101RZE2_9ACTN|nr:hypothetical protein AQJ46_29175 [Streptomyces canus]
MPHALQYQDRRVDLLLSEQSPLDEVLAAPSAAGLDGLAVRLVDVSDEIRHAERKEIVVVVDVEVVHAALGR